MILALFRGIRFLLHYVSEMRFNPRLLFADPFGVAGKHPIGTAAPAFFW